MLLPESISNPEAYTKSQIKTFSEGLIAADKDLPSIFQQHSVCINLKREFVVPIMNLCMGGFITMKDILQLPNYQDSTISSFLENVCRSNYLYPNQAPDLIRKNYVYGEAGLDIESIMETNDLPTFSLKGKLMKVAVLNPKIDDFNAYPNLSLFLADFNDNVKDSIDSEEETFDPSIYFPETFGNHIGNIELVLSEEQEDQLPLCEELYTYLYSRIQSSLTTSQFYKLLFRTNYSASVLEMNEIFYSGFLNMFLLDKHEVKKVADSIITKMITEEEDEITEESETFDWLMQMYTSFSEGNFDENADPRVVITKVFVVSYVVNQILETDNTLLDTTFKVLIESQRDVLRRLLNSTYELSIKRLRIKTVY